MGFSVAVSFGPLNLYRICHHKSANLVNFGQREGHAMNLKLSNSRPRLRSISCCKPEVFEFEERTSPNEVKKEIERCYELIRRLGRGVVYLGSSRMGSNHPHYLQALELGREARAGPGLMDAAIKGALQAGKPVGGFKIGKEAGEWTATNFHPYLPSENYLTCRFFSARKHGLVDAAVRSNSSDRTAVLPVPFLLMNYDSFYSKLLEFLDDCEHWGTVAKGEVSSLWKVCNNNLEALAYLEEFYDLPTDKFRGGDSLRHPYRTVS
ncbi:putative lysine decarboxylase family protein [Actinidia rufa]|uniref:Putative lysine decarboxylase family protein n=1 Tax=Actinidia rufa TaxID=165716 RepID=A0A7J0HFT0_9ERIC|nr:putative lysine decarboxylase family protein [Actinidia rufa]